MTREEAIKILKQRECCRECVANCTCNECDKAFEMAIEALKQEPCEDTISRKAVLETIDDCNSDGLKGIFCSYGDGERFKEYIKELPSVISKGVTVTDFADKCRECGEEHRQLAEWLEELKQLREQTRWIPCSEKLPEEEGDYLLWGKVCEDEDEYPFIGSYDSGCEQFGIWQEQFDATTLGCLGSEFFEYASVIAWKPLPEPYKEVR